MAQRDAIKGNDETPPPGEAGIETPPAADAAPADATPKMALATIAPPRVSVAKVVDASEIDRPVDIPAIEAPRIALSIHTKTETLTIENPGIAFAAFEAPRLDAPGIDMPRVDEVHPTTAADFTSGAGQTDDAAATMEGPRDSAGARSHRFPLLAASLVLAASLGAMVGTLASTTLLMRSAPPPVVVAAKSGLEEVQALKEQVVQLRVDLAAIKTSVEAGHRNANAQFTRIGERVERIDRTQAEPVAKLTKAIEGFERRADVNAARETTGSITPPQSIANQPAKPSGVVEGWVLRDVQRGTALIEGRFGMIEVDAGDVVPGLGRVDAIRKQDGRWVVVTSKGLIVPPR
jgi:hypothetical protein